MQCSPSSTLYLYIFFTYTHESALKTQQVLVRFSDHLPLDDKYILEFDFCEDKSKHEEYVNFAVHAISTAINERITACP